MGVTSVRIRCLPQPHRALPRYVRAARHRPREVPTDRLPSCSVLPASLFGFCSTGSAVLLSGLVGNLVDNSPRLRFVRLCIVAQKATVAAGYGAFLVLFLRLGSREGAGKWLLFALITALSAVLNLATVS